MNFKTTLLTAAVVVLSVVTTLFAIQKQAVRQTPRAIRVGQNIQEAIQVMERAGLKEYLPLQIVPAKKTERLTGWPVSEGHLTACYSVVDHKIVDLELYLVDQDCQRRFKSEQVRNLTFEVKAYAPDTGDILMKVPHKGMPSQQRPQSR